MLGGGNIEMKSQEASLHYGFSLCVMRMGYICSVIKYCLHFTFHRATLLKPKGHTIEDGTPVSPDIAATCTPGR